MSFLVFRKLLNNRGMFVCLLIGFLIVATVVSSIPMFTSAILQRVLIRDLQSEQAKYGEYAGMYRVTQEYNYAAYANDQVFPQYNRFIEDSLAESIKVPTVADVTRVTMTRRAFVEAPFKNSIVQYLSVVGLTDFNDKVTPKFGRMYNPGLVDGAYEVVISEYTMKTLQLTIGQEYLITYPFSSAELFSQGACFKVRLVGVVAANDINDPYWFYDMTTYSADMFMDFDTLVADFGDDQHVTSAVWYKAYDYTQIEISDISSIVNTLETHTEQYKEMSGSLRFYMPTIEVMKEYLVREERLQITLWVLVLPLLILLCFYIFMVSRLKLDSEVNEISVLKSRGASRMQIFSGYILEWGILAGFSLLIGPWLGLVSCYFLGSANGFLDFVSRTALPVNISWDAYLYTLAAMVLFAVAMLIPAVAASKLSIVERKQINARSAAVPLWKKLGVDFVLIAVAVYGRVRYQSILSGLSGGDDTVASMGIDPLMFIITSAFILGIGLLFIRIYPFIVRLIFWVGKRRWSPALYSSFIRIGKSGSKEIFVMLFIIFSIGVGVFSANSARTVNSNLVDRCEYLSGADVVVRLNYDYLAQMPTRSEFEQSDAIDSATEVILASPGTNGFTIKKGSTKLSSFTLMGIEPYSFGMTTTLRSDLLPYQLNEYLNLINGAQTAVLLSSDYADKVSVGDTLTLSSDVDSSLSVVVYGFVDYWPGMQTVSYVDGEEVTNSFIVINSSYLKTHYARSINQLSQFWLKRANGSTIEDIVASMDVVKENISLSDLTDYDRTNIGSMGVKKILYGSQDIVEIKNDPTIQGFNGMLSLVFLITMGITTVGFLIYWVLSLRSRTLQFGIYRAIGMSQRSIIGMIGIEQVLVSVMSILFGLLLGDVTSLIYINLFEMVYSNEERIIPFRVFHDTGDYLKIYGVIAVMLIVGAIVLTKAISSIKIDQALKLGED